MSRQAQRLACLAGGSWSFDCAAKHLKEFCGLSLADNTIRAVCQGQGSAMAAWQREDSAAQEPFRCAVGDIEFTTDGTCVNTWEGWREMRVGIFSKRRRGEPADAAGWATRKLPAPHVRVAFAAIEKSERFASRWSAWATRLGMGDRAQVSVLGDGARWIWDQSALHFPGATEVLDIYHGLEHVAQTAKVLYGEETAAAKSWNDTARDALLTEGWPAMKRHLQTTRDQVATTQTTRGRVATTPSTRGRVAKTQTTRGRVWKKAQRHSLDDLAGYLGRSPEHLCYARRLAEGRSIGSGQVEGACKHAIGRRLKQTGARWRVRRVNRMANLCCLLYSDQWDAYWKNP